MYIKMDSWPDKWNSFFVEGLKILKYFFENQQYVRPVESAPPPFTNMEDVVVEFEKICYAQLAQGARNVQTTLNPINKNEKIIFYTTGNNQKDVIKSLRGRRSALVSSDDTIIGFGFPLLPGLYWMYPRTQVTIDSFQEELVRI